MSEDNRLRFVVSATGNEIADTQAVRLVRGQEG